MLKRQSLLHRLYVGFFSKSLHVVYIYRVFHAIFRSLSGRPAVWRALRPFCEMGHRAIGLFFCGLKGIEIHYSTTIGPGLRLVHPHNIVLTPQTVIGENCTIFNGVTCGVNHLDRSGYPVIGNDVVLYPGAKVIGNVTIGDTVIIGANAVVVRDVPSNSIAVGVPAVVKKSLESPDQIAW